MKKGFTLIELLVSVGIFTVVMTIALGALLSVAESDRRAQSLKTITNNLGFALESMSRTIRTGIDYRCGSSLGGDCPNGDDAFFFTPACVPAFPCPPPQTAYRHSDDGDECGQEDSEEEAGCILRSQDGGSNWQPITAPEVVVTDLSFYLVGSTRGDALQPRLTIAAIGYVEAVNGQRSEFRIQTSVTQRLYDQ